MAFIKIIGANLFALIEVLEADKSSASEGFLSARDSGRLPLEQPNRGSGGANGLA